MFFSQSYIVALTLSVSLLIFLGLLFWVKLFSYNLESNYFLGNYLKLISTSCLFWLTPSMLHPLLSVLAIYLVGDFLSYLLLSIGFFVLCFLFWRSISVLLRLFYSTVFSGLSFYAVFMLPLSLIFYLKLVLLKEFFVLVLASTLSYLSFRLGKTGFLEVHSHISLRAFFGLSFCLI